MKLGVSQSLYRAILGQHYCEVSCATCLRVKRGVLPVVASVVSGRPVGESSLTFASRGRLATPSGTSRPKCGCEWEARRGGRRRRGSLLGCVRPL